MQLSRLSRHPFGSTTCQARETTLTLRAVATEPDAQAALAERIATVRAQLEPIRSRSALLDSYRRESLCRLASGTQASGSAADVLDMAYAMRWRDLEAEGSPGYMSAYGQNGLVDE